MDIKISGHSFIYDVTSMAMMFFPGDKINYVTRSNKPIRAYSYLRFKENKAISSAKVIYNNKVYTCMKTAPCNCDSKNIVKYTLYKALSKATGITSPWGILTGIRPLSVYNKHNKDSDVTDILKKEYLISSEKISMLSEINAMEAPLFKSNYRDISVYISIPFCPSKCTYCSFISVAATKQNNLINEYISKLCIEIKQKAEFVKKYNLRVRTLYIGGGTPGILSEDNLSLLLNIVNKHFDFKSVEEICFELGRPDTVTENKLKILKQFNINRICINTQTTNDDILRNVNRNHSFNDYKSAVKLAQGYNFDSVNTDLIAGLPNEDYISFCNSLNDVINSGVDNITIHTLAIKKSSKLSESKENYRTINGDIHKMLEFAYNTLKKHGYLPYYIYRQKNCISNGENIGFCKVDKICKYNVYMMEDVHSVIACGAGASTKIIKNSNVNRIINVKYPMEYVNEFYKVENNVIKTEKMLKEILFND